MTTLTICIPSNNRLDWVAEKINVLESVSEYDFDVQIVCEPTDERDPELFEEQFDTSVNLYIADSEMGFAASIIQLVELARGEFIMFLSDEDFVNPNAIPWLVDIIQTEENVTRIIGASVHQDGSVYIDPLNSQIEPGGQNSWKNSTRRYESKESIQRFFSSQMHLSGPVIRRESIDPQEASAYIDSPYSLYIHTILNTQATKAGETLYSPMAFCRLGSVQIHEHGSDHNLKSNRAIQLRERVRNVIPNMITNGEIKQQLISNERQTAAVLLLMTLRDQPTEIAGVLRVLLPMTEITLSVGFWKSILQTALAYIYKIISGHNLSRGER